MTENFPVLLKCNSKYCRGLVTLGLAMSLSLSKLASVLLLLELVSSSLLLG